ncbi:hypothetical protein [Paratractidigestivibacter sp.]|uniref:hypothetical protein n=1 Tax=Paratractidigestivibacter sp. TaxID=2847316 RepID=UPI002AC9B3F1|nr:hypothetical protein [Paratractidigestivibacter sp.]
MKESIGEKIVELVSPLVKFYLSEAETESYPYAVYDMDVTPYYTKDGVYRYSADATVRLFGKDFDELDGLWTKIEDALMMMDQGYTSTYTGYSKTCTEGVWQIEMNFNILQFK